MQLNENEIDDNNVNDDDNNDETNTVLNLNESPHGRYI